jgi:hypothetical protein
MALSSLSFKESLAIIARKNNARHPLAAMIMQNLKMYTVSAFLAGLS